MRKKTLCNYLLTCTLTFLFLFLGLTESFASDKEIRKIRQLEDMQKDFKWWPTDARPGPVKDEGKGGYWWWPVEPGKATPWGNRGYIYVYKIIFDYKEEELPPPKPKELRPSLLIKKVIKNVKVYFDYDKAALRDDASKILEGAVGTLKRNPETSILITGSCDVRGSKEYNEKLGRKRGESVKQFMLDKGVSEDRIKIVSRGKLDAVAPVTDLTGMQKERNAQFMVAEVEEVMIPYEGAEKLRDELDIEMIDEGKYLVEEEKTIESELRVSTKPYTIQEGDTLAKIAKEYLGGSHRAKFLYEFNKDKIKDPDNLTKGTAILIPIEQESQAVKESTQTKTVSQVSTREYIVIKNDTLSKIARKELGNGLRWKEISELNKDRLKNPDRLIPGMRLRLPAK
ncbi:MAG: LysM peptidoglycan-binding domain-containing protein [Candidatus Omnitrophota bacterium]